MGHVSSYPRADVESSVGSLVDGGANGYAPPVDHHAAPSAALRCPQLVGFRWGHHPFPLRRAPPPRHSSRIPTFVPRIPTFVTNVDTPAANLQVRPCAPRAPRAPQAPQHSSRMSTFVPRMSGFVTNVERKCTASPLGAAEGCKIRHECRDSCHESADSSRMSCRICTPVALGAQREGCRIRHECRDSWHECRDS